MMPFLKNEETFRRFCIELVSANPQLINLNKVGVDMEVSIFSGFQSAICKLLQLYCGQHLLTPEEQRRFKTYQKKEFR